MKTKGDPRSEKLEAFSAAACLLEKQDDTLLRYAALELRRCMEALIYEKLLVYGDLLPEASVHQWQPDKAFSALMEIDPLADETVTISVAPQSDPHTLAPGPFVALGTDQRPKLKWVKKTWNKLGFYLHADWPFGRGESTAVSLRAFLQETLTTLTPLVNNTFNMSMVHPIIVFKCGGCGEEVKNALRVAEVKRTAVCLTCGKRYRAVKVGEEFSFVADGPSLTCECGTANFFRVDDLKEGYTLSCRGCQATIEFVAQQWQYRIIAAGKGDPESSSEEP